MRQTQNVKTRFALLLLAAGAVGIAGFLLAEQSPPARSIGERAVTEPRPPVIVPATLDEATATNSTIRIILATQRLQLLVSGKVAIDSPASVGRKGAETPAGKFIVKRKEPEVKQDSFGNLTDAQGKTIVRGVYRDRDPVPSELRFSPRPLKYALLIEGQNFKIHAGPTSTLPVTDGSVIIPAEIAKTVFSKIGSSCPVEIVAASP